LVRASTSSFNQKVASSEQRTIVSAVLVF